MPPTGGMGMGIDRLLMALTGLGIRETILFPLVRPEQRLRRTGHEREDRLDIRRGNPANCSDYAASRQTWHW